MKTSPSGEGAERILLIEAGRLAHRYWQDLWDYRELFYVLAWRDLAVRYKQTLLGLAWALLRPLLTVVIFTILFERIAHLPSTGDAPYAMMVLAGVLPWQFFSSALSESAASLISNASLVSKVYFPRLIVPAASMVVALADLLVSFLLLLALMAWYRLVPSWQIALLPAFVLMAFLASLGPGLWVTSLNVKYRDFRYVIPFLLQLGLYVSPVAFASTIVPEPWRLLYSLNPVVGVIDGFRWAILGDNAPPYWPGLALGCAVTVLFLWLGVRQFRRMERSFADVI